MKVNSKDQEPTVIKVLDDGHMAIVKHGSEWQFVNWIVFDEMVDRHNKQVDEIENLNAIIDEMIDELRWNAGYEVYTPRMVRAEFAAQARRRFERLNNLPKRRKVEDNEQLDNGF